MAKMSEGGPRWAIAPYFIVDDVVATANYYRDKLGFRYERFWGEPPAFCMDIACVLDTTSKRDGQVATRASWVSGEPNRAWRSQRDAA